MSERTRDASAAATLARMPLINDPVISAAVAAFDEGYAPEDTAMGDERADGVGGDDLGWVLHEARRERLRRTGQACGIVDDTWPLILSLDPAHRDYVFEQRAVAEAVAAVVRRQERQRYAALIEAARDVARYAEGTKTVLSKNALRPLQAALAAMEEGD